jgi:hypothetical protein
MRKQGRKEAMNPRFIRKALVTVMLLGAFAGAHAQEGEASERLDADLQRARADAALARKDIQKADAELRKSDSLMREESQRAAQTEDRQAKDRDRREKENAALQAKVQDAQKKIDAERNAAARHQNAVDEIKARQKQLLGLLAGYCDSVAARIDGGLPWDKESRLDRVLALKRDLQAGSASPDEGFGRLSAVLKDETKLGDEIAAFNKPITRKDGEVVNAQILKIGNLWLVYMDEEAKRFGALEKTPKGWEWREDLSFAEKNSVRAALEVKGAKRPPQLVTLDLGILPTGAAAAKGGNP